MEITIKCASLDELQEFFASLKATEAPTNETKINAKVKKEVKNTTKTETNAMEKTTKQEEPKQEEPKQEEPVYTLADVRTKLAQLTKNGKKAEVKNLLEGFNVEKLSELPQEHYAEAMRRAEVL